MDSSLGVSTAELPHEMLFTPTQSTWMFLEFWRVPLAMTCGPFSMKKMQLRAPTEGRLTPGLGSAAAIALRTVAGHARRQPHQLEGIASKGGQILDFLRGKRAADERGFRVEHGRRVLGLLPGLFTGERDGSPGHYGAGESETTTWMPHAKRRQRDDGCRPWLC